MDFYAHQEQARRRTTLLVGYFILAVVAIIASIYVAVVMGLPYFTDQPLVWWNPAVFLLVTIATLIVVTLGSLWQIAQLSSGGSVVATMLGGVRVNPGVQDLKYRRLLNVVEEMAIASGSLVPPVYVLPKEQAINAFAAGFTTKDAVIAVSHGALEQLSRDELQGVIGHEFSHILRGDIRLNIRLMGLLHGILLISLIGTILFRVASEILRYTRSSDDSSSSSDDKKGGNPVAALALGAFGLGAALYIIGYVGVFFGQLIKAAVSRQREFLADASSVQFTRNPTGLVGALRQIASFATGSRLSAPLAAEAAHMFFANGLHEAFIGLLATHPPLPERIRRLDPRILAEAGIVISQVATAATTSTLADGESPAVGFAGETAVSPGVAPPDDETVVTAEVVSQVGAPSEDHLAYAAELRARGWGELSPLLNDAYSASSVVFALLISTDASVAAQQFATLAKLARPDLVEATQRVVPLVAPLSRSRRLPLVEVASTALLQLSREQFGRFRQVLEALAQSDGKIELFEYALIRVLVAHLEPHLAGERARPGKLRQLDELRGDALTLLRALAQAGNDDDTEKQRAFANALRVLKCEAPFALASLADFDRALAKLIDLRPEGKRQLIQACAECISTDGRATVSEAELLRVICATLECPVPPVIETAG